MGGELSSYIQHEIIFFYTIFIFLHICKGTFRPLNKVKFIELNYILSLSTRYLQTNFIQAPYLILRKQVPVQKVFSITTMIKDVTPQIPKSARQSLIICADTAPGTFCTTSEENRNQSLESPSATAAALSSNTSSRERSALPTVTTVARERRSQGRSHLLTCLLTGVTSVLRLSWTETGMNYLLGLVGRSIQTTKQVKKLATTETTTTSNKYKSPTTASPKFSEQLILASATTQKAKTTHRREIFRNQRLTSKRPRESPFSGAVLVTQPSVVTSTSSSTTTAMKTKLATTPSSKLNNSNVKKVATLKPKVQTKRDDIIIWQK